MQLRFNLILLLLVFCIAMSDGQIYKRFSIEVGMNRSRNVNTETVFSSESGSTTIIIEDESASYTNNYDVLFGYKITKRHHFRIRFSKNTIGGILTGSHRVNDDDSSFYFLSFHNRINIIKNYSWGALYEYHIVLPLGYIPIGLGIERQKNDLDDTYLFVPGTFPITYAIHTAIGYVYPIFQYTYLSAKAYVTKSFNNNIQYSDQNSGMYVPLQIGLSLGLRFSLE